MSLRRLGNLTSKHGNLQYYKGTGARTGGRHTSKGKFIIDPLLQRFIVTPKNLDKCGFRPYVARELVAKTGLAPEIRRLKRGKLVDIPKTAVKMEEGQRVVEATSRR